METALERMQKNSENVFLDKAILMKATLHAVSLIPPRVQPPKLDSLHWLSSSDFTKLGTIQKK